MTLLLAPTLAELSADPSEGSSLRKAMDAVAQCGFRVVQLATGKRGLKPRNLDGSARRDLLATLRRRELQLSGLDCWIPPDAFLESSTVDRAVDALLAAMELAASLERCPLSVSLPDSMPADVLAALGQASLRHGVLLADHRVGSSVPPPFGLGLDPAAWLAAGEDPVEATHSGQVHSARLVDLGSTGMRGPVGEAGGRLDVTAYKVGLSVGGYSRPVVVDLRQWIDPWGGLQMTHQVWQRF